MSSRGAQITALLISPNRRIAQQFATSTAKSLVFDIVGEMEAYPSAPALETRIRQLRPEVLLIDVATDLDAASDLIRFATSLKPPTHVVGLHTHNDSQAILRSLRFGASEFLYAPFEVSIQEAALTRIQKLLHQLGGNEKERGKVAVFTSVKPGSGASTLAVQTAYAVRRATKRRVLVTDFDLVGGSAGFYLGVQHDQSVLDLLQRGRINPELWSAVTADADGVDVLPAPDMPHVDPVDFRRLAEILSYARNNYEWTIVDVPTIFNRLTLMAVAESDRAFLVSTSELASLHLARRAVKMLAQLGVDSTKYQVLINRIDEKNDLNPSNLSKLFDCRVDSSLPDDKLGIQRVVALGKPLDSDSHLGKAVDALAGKLMGALPDEPRPTPRFVPRPAWSQS